jgi:phosphoglycerol transferase
VFKDEAVCFYISSRRNKKILAVTAVIMPFIGLASLGMVLDIPGYIRFTSETPSNFYEQHYIDPGNIEITFPEKRRNLIVIFVESLETGFLYLTPDSGMGGGGDFRECYS